MTDNLRFAVVGCGRMGLRRLKAARQNPNGSVFGLSDADEQLAQQLSAEFGCTYFPDPMDLVKSPDVNCVIVAVPNKFHLELTLAALESGKNVWCEKPLARTPEEAALMVETAIRCNRFLKVGSNLRFFPTVTKAKELLSQGAIGKVLFLRGWVGNNGWQLKSWFGDPELSGGGTFLDNGSHLLDIARWFLGEALECTGFVSTGHWQVQPLEDNGMGIFRFQNGALGFIHASWTEWQEYCYIEVYGSDGFLRIDNRNPRALTLFGKREGEEQVWDFSALPPSSYQREMDEFIRMLLADEQPQPSGFDGLRAVQMAHGLYEASRTGRVVSLWGDREKMICQRALGGVVVL